MDRIADRFSLCKSEGRAAFVAYICAGDPDYQTSLEVCKTLVEGGIDVLEIGMPFSDPLADGLTNQLAAQRALDSGMTQAQVFKLAAEVRKLTDIPIILYTYYNLVYVHGHDGFVRKCADAGADGILTLDLPPEYASEMVEATQKAGLKNIFIVAPTTPESRVEIIAKSASGFIYYVSREGVTGERSALATNISESMRKIKAHTDLPVVVGFGISNAQHVREVAALSDGAVVGSALVNCIARNLNQPEEIVGSLRAKLQELMQGLKN